MALLPSHISFGELIVSILILLEGPPMLLQIFRASDHWTRVLIYLFLLL